MPIPINFKNLLNKNVVERFRVECKRDWNPLEFVISVCAFANDIDNFGGGYIIIGAEFDEEKDAYSFFDLSNKRIDQIQQEISEYCLKCITPQYVPVTDVVEFDGKRFLVVWAYAGYDRPYKCKDKPNDIKHSREFYYIRKGSTSIKAVGSLEKELLSLGAKEPFDDRLNYGATIDDLNLDLIKEFLKRTESNLLNNDSLTKKDYASSLHIIGGPEESLHPRNIGLLMFSLSPEAYLPYSYIDLVIINNPNGRDMTEKRFTGSLLSQYDAVLSFFKNMVYETKIIKQIGEEASKTYANYPLDAFDEIVANAILHKDYSEPHPISIRIEKEAIFVTSYPGFDHSIQDKDIASYAIRSERYRNRRVAEFLKELHIVEAHNTGIPTILDACDDNDSDYPIFISDSERSFLTVKLPISKAFLDKKENRRDLTKEIEALLKRGDLTLSQISRALGYDQITGSLKRTLKILIANGTIIQEGKKYHLSTKQ